MERILLQESTTFGLRRHICQRSILPRRQQTVSTPFGPIRMKVGLFAGRETTWSAEFEDCQKAAREHNVTVKEVMAAAQAAYKKTD